MAKRIGGIAGIWTEEHLVLEAARKTRASGCTKFDAITPYPVHGMEEAVGVKRSTIPYVTFVAALVGLSSGLALTIWTSATSWPINVGGKPFISLPAFIPVVFELTILFAALSSVAALFYHCKMPQIDPPTIDPDLTSHKFAIFVPENDTAYDPSRLEKLFREAGATDVRKVAEF